MKTLRITTLIIVTIVLNVYIVFAVTHTVDGYKFCESISQNSMGIQLYGALYAVNPETGESQNIDEATQYAKAMWYLSNPNECYVYYSEDYTTINSYNTYKVDNCQFPLLPTQVIDNDAYGMRRSGGVFVNHIAHYTSW